MLPPLALPAAPTAAKPAEARRRATSKPPTSGRTPACMTLFLKRRRAESVGSVSPTITCRANAGLETSASEAGGESAHAQPLPPRAVQLCTLLRRRQTHESYNCVQKGPRLRVEGPVEHEDPSGQACPHRHVCCLCRERGLETQQACADENEARALRKELFPEICSSFPGSGPALHLHLEGRSPLCTLNSASLAPSLLISGCARGIAPPGRSSSFSDAPQH